MTLAVCSSSLSCYRLNVGPIRSYSDFSACVMDKNVKSSSLNICTLCGLPMGLSISRVSRCLALYSQCQMFHAAVSLSTTKIHRAVTALFSGVHEKAHVPMGALQHRHSQTQLWVWHLSWLTAHYTVRLRLRFLCMYASVSVHAAVILSRKHCLFKQTRDAMEMTS